MNIFELRDRIREINPVGIAETIVYGSQDMIVELNREQMERGKDATGDDIAPTYRSDAYAELKQRMNSQPEFGTPDLQLTGDFYREMYFDTGAMNPYGSNPKTASLVKKYGKWIFGLNEESLQKYRPYFNRKFKEEVENIMVNG